MSSEQPGHPYPALKAPVGPRALRREYDRYNRELFGGLLPPVRITYSERMSRAFGRAVNKGASVALESRYEIRLAGMLRRDVRELVDTLLHEMIHIYQWEMHRQTEDRYYLDARPVPGRPFVNKGHGAVFHQKAAELDARGFRIDVYADLDRPESVPDGVRRYGIVLELRDGRRTLFRLPAPFETLATPLVSSLRRRYGAETLRAVTPLETDSLAVMSWPLVTRSGALKRSQRAITYKRYYVEQVLANPAIEFGEEQLLIDPALEQLSAENRELIAALRRYRHLDLPLYLDLAREARSHQRGGRTASIDDALPLLLDTWLDAPPDAFCDSQSFRALKRLCLPTLWGERGRAVDARSAHAAYLLCAHQRASFKEFQDALTRELLSRRLTGSRFTRLRIERDEQAVRSLVAGWSEPPADLGGRREIASLVGLALDNLAGSAKVDTQAAVRDILALEAHAAALRRGAEAPGARRPALTEARGPLGEQATFGF
ncbi:hypothetical protein J2T57_001708 [Natronocella acetinitrilica]|uniref:SprT-like domain-containing protein n=1 Tax=Natronocella acetinitrilica TaxID=414046 RepID=A0AAE3G4I5_9GAMM|nr:SprT-like domain-containing protein [Natronocella acetinitrilica]MCP1674606.1 hypothetical protein [Natronocella acetinitrilica]